MNSIRTRRRRTISRPNRKILPPEPDPCRGSGLDRQTIDAAPGISRRKRGGGWTFAGPRGRTITDPAERRRILSLAIPPAWRDVWINPDRNAPVQATGFDVAGRKQYRYHPAFREERDADKFDHLPSFAEKLPALRDHVRKALRSDDEWERALAAAVRLLDGFAIRIGSDESITGSYGMTTLLNRHATIRGDTVELCFYGKGHIRQRLAARDAALAAALAELKRAEGGKLFALRRGLRIHRHDVNEWICDLTDGCGTAKTFRTWRACTLAAERLMRGPVSVKELLAEVSSKLGNTPAVCRKSYIAPAFIDLAKAGLTIKAPDRPRRLRTGERAALKVLKG
jgi:DNA topoisomerase-1